MRKWLGVPEAGLATPMALLWFTIWGGSRRRTRRFSKKTRADPDFAQVRTRTEPESGAVVGGERGSRGATEKVPSEETCEGPDDGEQLPT